jgi:hypothetical protein
MPKLKDKTHSEYVHQLMGYKKRITEIQQWITKEKDMITITMKMSSRTGISIDFDRLALLRNEAMFLAEQIKIIKAKIKTRQKSNSNSTPYHYRMYSMVLRQLTPMQKGIQSLHSVVEYGEMMKQDNVSELTKKAYEAWANRDKTMIVLDAGTSMDLVDVIFKLKELNVPHTVFHEPDLYGCITSVCFIADERVWDVKNYPSYEDYIQNFDTKSSNAPALHYIQQEYLAENVFNCADPANILELRELIFSKKLSM